MNDMKMAIVESHISGSLCIIEKHHNIQTIKYIRCVDIT